VYILGGNNDNKRSEEELAKTPVKALFISIPSNKPWLLSLECCKLLIIS